MENNNRLDNIIEEINKDPAKVINFLNNEIMRAEMELEALNKEKEASKKLILESGDEEVISILNKIENPDLSPEEVEKELDVMKNKVINDIKTLLDGNEDIINMITQ